MKTARAWAPGNISLLFKVVPDPDPSRMGSLGVGFTINEGATVTVTRGVNNISYNGKDINLPTVTDVANTLTSVSLSIAITSPLPLGSGFGISGAATLASAYAINRLLALGKIDLELAKIAHRAEVVNKTGLGDVVNQFYGGFFVKFVTSAKFQVQRLPIVPIPVYCKSYGKLLTSSVLSDTSMIKQINKEAGNALSRIAFARSFADIIAIANRFTQNTHLIIPQIKKQINEIERRDGHAAQILLGNAIVSDIPFPGSMKLQIDTKKATVLG